MLLTEALELAMAAHDITKFQALLQDADGIPLRFSSETSKARKLSLIEKVVTYRFVAGLKFLLSGQSQALVSPKDVNNAWGLSVTTKSKARGKRRVVTTFLAEALAGNTHVHIIPRDIFRFSMRCKRFDLATKALACPRFDPNAYIPLDGYHYDRPLHMATACGQIQLAEKLLEMGANVDALKSGRLSALMLAAIRMSPKACQLLLHHGADPNHPPLRKAGNKLIYIARKESLRRLFHVPRFPDYVVRYRPSQFTLKADKIVRYLLYAGLKLSKDTWLENTSTAVHFSVMSAKKLRKQKNRVKSLKEMAVYAARQYCNYICNGCKFRETVNGLDIPPVHKKQILLVKRVFAL